MGCSLKTIVALLLGTVIVIVGGACVAVMLATSLQSINTVGVGFAQNVARAVSDVTLDWFNNVAEATVDSLRLFMETEVGLEPPEFLAATGKNWSRDFLLPKLLFSNAKLGYSVNSINWVYERSSSWCFAARSRIDQSLSDTECIEFPTTTAPAVTDKGLVTAYFYSMANGTRHEISTDPRWEGYSSETDKYGVTHAIGQVAAVTQMRGLMKSLLRTRGRGTMAVMPPIATYLPEVQSWFQFPIIGVAVRKPNMLQRTFDGSEVLGTAMITMPATLALSQLIDKVHKVSNRSTNWLIDSGTLGTIVTSTARNEHPTFYFKVVASGVTAPNGTCSMTEENSPHIKPFRMGCRVTWRQTSYAPLRLAPEAVVQTRTSDTATVEANGERFLVVAQRLTTTRARAVFQTVVVVPEEDIFGQAGNILPIVVGASVGVAALGLLVAVFVIASVLASLEDMQQKMSDTAQLKGLDEDDELDEEGGNNDHDDDVLAGADSSAILAASGNSNASLGGASSPSSADDDSPTAPNQRAGFDNNNHNAQQPSHSTSVSAKQLSSIAEVQKLQLAYTAARKNLINMTRYVPRSIVRELMFSGAQAELSHDYVATFICDLAGFTQITERVTVAVLSQLMTAYLSSSTKLVMQHHGVVGVLIGDAVSAFFGGKLFPVARPELLATCAALSVARLAYNRQLKTLFEKQTGGHPLKIRVGVAAGNVVLGPMGSAERVQYSVVGEPAVTCNALEPANKQLGTLVLVDENVARACGEEICMRLIMRGRAVGRRAGFAVYEPMGILPDAEAAAELKRGARGGGVDTGSSAGGSSSAGSGNSGNSGGSGGGASSSDLASDARSGVSSSTVMTAGGASVVPSMHAGAGIVDALDTHGATEKVSVRRVLRWHIKHGSRADAKAQQFAQQFTEAARAFIDGKFHACLSQLEQLVGDGNLTHDMKNHASVAWLRAQATRLHADKAAAKAAMDDTNQVTLPL